MRSAFTPLRIPVRRAHLETPHSYLRRLCAANIVDSTWLERQVRARRQNATDPHRLGMVIFELGGPTPEAFSEAHRAATFGMMPLRPAFAIQRTTRAACLACTAGQSARTYAHIRFAFCRKHGRWLGEDIFEQRAGCMDALNWAAEQRLRRLVSSGHVDERLYRTAWTLVRDNAYLAGGKTWSDRLKRAHDQPGFTREVDDRLALFPETVRVLNIVTRPGFVEAVAGGRRDSTERRAYLHRAFNWIPEERWVLCEGIDQFFNTDHPAYSAEGAPLRRTDADTPTR